VKRLLAYYGLACFFTWPLAALYSVSSALPLLGLFGPAAAACIVVGTSEGRPGLRSLLARLGRWRVGLEWYAFAPLVPLLLVSVVWVAHAVRWEPTVPLLEVQSPITLALAFLVVGEELGWRGFALRELQQRVSPLTASLILGAAWGFWHLMNFLIPGYPHFGRSLLAFVAATMAYSVLFTLLFNRTGGSVLLVTLLHAAINLLSPRGIPIVRAQWLEVIVYAVAAVATLWLAGPRLGAPVGPPPSPAPERVPELS
jgi:membrane protease YdiL (CAAX protease family)